MRLFSSTRLMWILTMLLVFTGGLWAQTAQLSGVVKDASGAIIPNAKLTLTNEGTGIKREVTSNEQGIYVIPYLQPGTYKLNVQTPGFKTVTRTGINLNVADRASVDFILEVGKLEQEITVESGESVTRTETTSLSTVVDHQFVDNMPLNGRTVQALLDLVPGVVPTTDSRQFNVNGQRGVSNSLSVDGASADIAGGMAPATVGLYGNGTMIGVTATGTTQAIATMDELQEFTVQTGGYGAELGRQSGAQISFATKSGTNQFHGSAFEYFRNEILDANDWFLNRQGLSRPKLRQNDFGGTFGGPIIKDKTFFFLALEYDPLLTPYSGSSTVPTQAYKNAAAAAIVPFLNMYPLPNGAIAANGLSGAYVWSDSVRAPVTAQTLKLDQNIGSRLSMFARYHRAPSRTDSPSGFSSNLVIFTNTQTGTFGATYTVTPRMVDQLRLNWSRSSSGWAQVFNSRDGTSRPPDSAIWPSGSGYNSNNSAFSVTINDGFNSGQVYFGNNTKFIQHQFQLTDSISLVWGKHKIDIGGDWRRMAPEVHETQDTEWSSITKASTAQMSIYPIVYGSGQFILNSLSLYAADTWKVLPRLTLNLGVRWELQPPPHSANSTQPFAAQNFDPNNVSVATLAPLGTPPWKTRHTNFAPRFGAAYHLFDKPGRDTVVRGAFGVYYDMGVGDALAFLNSTPYNRIGATTIATYPDILSNPAILPPAVILNPPFSYLKLFDPNLKMPYILNWNFGVQQSLGRNQSISADYVGNRGKRLLMSFTKYAAANSLVVSPGSITEVTNLAASWYDALQVQFNRRMAHGLQVLANYTLSRSTDLASDETALSIAGSVLPATVNRGASSFDVRHNFTAAATWQIPAPFANRALKAALGGWALNPMVRAYSAKPINPVYSYSAAGVATYSSLLQPDVVSGVPVWLYDSTYPGGKQLNFAAFSVPRITDPTQLRQGTAARNSIRGFPATQADIAVRRDFKVTERIGLQFSGEVYNIFNHPNFNNPSAGFGTFNAVTGTYSAPSSATFGLATAMLSKGAIVNVVGSPMLPIYAFGGQRDIQFAFKITF